MSLSGVKLKCCKIVDAEPVLASAAPFPLPNILLNTEFAVAAVTQEKSLIPSKMSSTTSTGETLEE